MKSVAEIRDNNLCCSCGICKNVCPVNAIKYIRENGMFVPEISDACVSCGKCYKVCPSVQHSYEKNNLHQAMTGNLKFAINAWSKDSDIRHFSASGGVITTIVEYLLLHDYYDYVFSVDTYNYHSQVKTNKYDKHSYNLNDISTQKYTKSRYIPVSHENLVDFILNNHDSRVIIIATSCAVRGILNVIDKFKLNRNNYLLLGLFCDQVYNYNCWEYYSDMLFDNYGDISEFNFKNKDSGGWTGNMKFYFSDGKCVFKNKSERVKIKDYFKPERCVYCVDKLNVFADISLGDNYTDQNSSSLGSNSVIIRTNLGEKIFKLISETIDYERIDVDKICVAQYFDGRKKNYEFSLLKNSELNDNFQLNSVMDYGHNSNAASEYKTVLRNLHYGEIYPLNRKKLIKQIQKSGRKTNQLKRIFRALLRRLRNES